MSNIIIHYCQMSNLIIIHTVIVSIMKRFFKALPTPQPALTPPISLEDAPTNQLSPFSVSEFVELPEVVSTNQVPPSLVPDFVTIPTMPLNDASSSKETSIPPFVAIPSISLEDVSSSEQVAFLLEPVTTPNASSSKGQVISMCEPSKKRSRVDLDLANLPSDPGLRPRMSEYSPNDQDSV